MKQKIALELTQKPILMDMVELYSFVLSAEATAQELIKKYGNFKKIKEEVEESIGGKDKEFAEEVLWAVRWTLLKTS